MKAVGTKRCGGGRIRAGVTGQAERLTYSVPEAARKLGDRNQPCYAAAKSGQIPTIKIGDRVLVPRIALDACS